MDQPRWLEYAWADLRLAETPGSGNSAKVVRYFAEVGHDAVTDDETAWCAAFLGACLERAGIHSTRSLMARSYLGWGAAVAEAPYGAIAVLSRGFDPRLGHVGFLVGSTSAQIMLLGGNQGNSVSVEGFPRSRLLALRWPAPTLISAPSVPPASTTAGEADSQTAAAGELFERALSHVLDMEGGYTDDPYDPGGPTNFGITLAVYARDKGLELTTDNVAALKAELKQIPQATVRRIYLERYWLPAACPQLPPAIALFHFDTAVNQGVTGAAQMLQQAVGAEMDGEIGPVTLAAAAAYPVAATLAVYAQIRRQRYRDLAQFWRFGEGWLRRVDRTLSLAAEIERAMPAITPSPQAKEPAMSDGTPTPSNPDSNAITKWWGSSVTIWGVVITALSTVLPAIGPILGIDITAELVRQLGDNVVQMGQALGGLVGTVLAIYGRVRATTQIERRQFTMTL